VSGSSQLDHCYKRYDLAFVIVYFMAHGKFFFVHSRGQGNAWSVYLQEDHLRSPRKVAIPGPFIGSVTSWEELEALGSQYKVDLQQITGPDHEEIKKELGLMP
jgi:hypothetical protein